jgi:hypothetical protein
VFDEPVDGFLVFPFFGRGRFLEDVDHCILHERLTLGQKRFPFGGIFDIPKLWGSCALPVSSFGYLHVFLRFDILIEHDCGGKIHNEEPAKHLGQHEHETDDNNRAQSVADWCQMFPEWCQMFPEWC